MLGFVLLIVIGLVVAGLMASFSGGNGSVSPVLSGVLGIVGSIVGGIVSLPLSRKLLGEGPEYIMALLGGAIGAFVLLMIVRLVKR
jgi:uncharacterized membrane protein YeaQ/YmgE (transglycosylase-associated protein family)